MCVAEGGPGCEQYFNRPDSHKLQTHCGSLLPKSHLRLCNRAVQRSIVGRTSPSAIHYPCQPPCWAARFFLFVCLVEEEKEGCLKNLRDFIRAGNTPVKPVKRQYRFLRCSRSGLSVNCLVRRVISVLVSHKKKKKKKTTQSGSKSQR